MSYAYVQTTGNTEAPSVGTIAVAQGSNPTAGNLLLVFVSSETVTTSPTVADSLGNTFTEIAGAKNTVGAKCTAFYAKQIIGGGANTVTATLNSADTNRTILVAEYGNIFTSTPLDAAVANQQVAPGTGTDAITSTAVTLVQSNELFVCFCIATAGSFVAFTAGTGFTLRFNAHPGFIRQMALEDTLSSSGSNTATYTTDTGAEIYTTQAIGFIDLGTPITGLRPAICL